MFSAQYKIFGSKKVKQMGLYFQKFWKDAIIFNTCCGNNVQFTALDVFEKNKHSRCDIHL